MAYFDPIGKLKFQFSLSVSTQFDLYQNQSCFCFKRLATVLEFSLCPGTSAYDCCRLPSCAREHAATSSLSRVTAAAFPPASEYTTAYSPARDHVCVLCLLHFVTVYRISTAYGVSPALAWRLYQVPMVSQVVNK